MNEYYNEINHLVKKLEVNKKARIYKDNSETLDTYWNIGKLIVEAQGGEEHAKYGNSLIEEWSEKLTSLYGKGYDGSNLRRFRQFYLSFSICGTVSHKLSWSHYQYLLPIKEENRRNYYINLSIEQNLSVRELRMKIKNKSYERLLVKPEHIEINSNEKYEIREHLKNPIIIKLDKEDKLLKEQDLQNKILAKLKNFFSELGQGYAFIGNEYKIVVNGKNYYMDLLLFNYKLNCFVVVELKFRELKIEDKSQIEFYMMLINRHMKESFHNKTIGIIISKRQDELIVSYVSSDDVIPITYAIKN